MSNCVTDERTNGTEFIRTLLALRGPKRHFWLKKGSFLHLKNEQKGQNCLVSQTSFFTIFSQIKAKNNEKIQKYDQKGFFGPKKGHFLNQGFPRFKKWPFFGPKKPFWSYFWIFVLFFV